MLSKNIGKNIRALRIGQGLSQKKLSDRSGLSIRYLSRLETEGGNITLDVVEQLARGLSCSPAEVLGDPKGISGSKRDAELLDQAIHLLQGIRSRL